MKSLLIISFFIISNACLFAQNNADINTNPAVQVSFSDSAITKNTESDTVLLTNKQIFIDEVVVSVNRWEQKKIETPQSVKIIRSDEILRYNPQTAADLVSQKGGVFIQKSQMGGGSPMIRGFSANRVLIMVDGIRMNNAIYRNGNLHNIITVDGQSIENTEIIFGPGSVIYGSDALGGVFSFNTLRPIISAGEKPVFSTHFFTRYSSANFEKTIHADFKSGGKKFAALLSATYTDFDDLHMGASGPEEYLRPEYVSDEPFTGKDLVLKNENQQIEKYTAYGQLNLLGKLLIRPSEYVDITFSANHSQTTDIPRYDRLIEYKGSQLAYAEWYYGPQKWSLFSGQVKYNKGNALFDKMAAIVGFQNYGESRFDRKLNNPIKNGREERLGIVTMNLDFDKKTNTKSELFYGFEGSFNHVNSEGSSINLLTGNSEQIASRYPDNSKYLTLAGYLSYKHKFQENLILSAGARYSYTHLEGVFDTTFYHFPFKGFDMNNQAVNGNIGLAWHTQRKLQLNLLVSSGFRSPNIDDVSRVFDSEPGHVVVPNPDLEPEYARNFELNISKTFDPKARFEMVLFYTQLKKAMVRRDYSLNGQDSMIYDGTPSKIEALVNAESAKIWGTEFGFEFPFCNFFKSRTNVSITRGEDSEGFPVRHVPPTFGSSHLIFERKKLFADLYADYSGKLNYEDLAPDEQDKPHLYVPDENGNPYSPAWWTLNLKSTYSLNKQLQLSGGVENILNKRYRSYSSGIVSPGINVIISVSYRF